MTRSLVEDQETSRFHRQSFARFVQTDGYFGNINWTWKRNCQSAPYSGVSTL